MRRALLLFLATIPALGAVSVAVAAGSGHNPDLVTDTVYEGSYGDSQNSWTAVPIQFAVTKSGRVNNFAPAEALCAPTQQITLTGADVKHDKFTSLTLPDSVVPIRLTVIGKFTAGGKAEGTGELRTETIEGQPCTLKGQWTALALPAGTEMCFSVDPEQVTHTTVTDMSCGEAESAYLAGEKEGGDTFQAPGWDCRSHSSEYPTASTVCTQGKKTFGLP